MDGHGRAATPPRRRWFAGWRGGGGRSVRRDDPADQGTAFGLEMSLLPASETPASPSSGAPRRRWWQRRSEPARRA